MRDDISEKLQEVIDKISMYPNQSRWTSLARSNVAQALWWWTDHLQEEARAKIELENNKQETVNL